jgi:MFS family permease
VDHDARLRSIRRRFLIVLALRWLPVGFLFPVMVLVMLERGLSLTAVGATVAVYGATVALMELPTGGLADSWGRKPTLIVASAIHIVGLAAFVFADTALWLALTWGVMGVARALDSGALEAWFVDATHEVEPDADLHPGLAQGGAVGAVGLAVGALLAGLLPDIILGGDAADIDLLLVPVAGAFFVATAHLAAIVFLVDERATAADRTGLLASLGEVPAVLRRGAKLAWRGSVIRRLIVATVAVGIGLSAVETLWQPRFAELLGSAAENTELFGLLAAVGFITAALGSALSPWAVRRMRSRKALAAAVGLVLAGASLVGLGAANGFLVAAIAYGILYLFIGVLGPIHDDLLHAEVSAAERSTMLSLSSLAGQTGGFVAAVGVASLADHMGIPLAWFAVAGVVALSSLLYASIERRTHR